MAKITFFKDIFVKIEEDKENEKRMKKLKKKLSTFASVVLFVVIVGGALNYLMRCNTRKVRNELNKESGFISDNMKRVVITPRKNLEESTLWNKLLYAEEDAIEWSECEYDTYWNEEGKVALQQ